ncbi:hypothetical protein [Corynebacterium sp.]|uniref:hypothetical protein n=1 Tax=Corynebacterium sp. TaxID=1720 RepID=UPI00198AFC24|nr:hypothetical protein [Corynebacterium sp.]HHU66874.1 hypothetical protein [Corynebacterium sp.]
MSRLRPALALLASSLLLTACSAGADGNGSDESIHVSTSETPVAAASQVDPVQAETLRGKTTDPGLNVDMRYQGARSGNTGGSIITVLVTNLNDEPLAVDALPQPTLTYNSGGGTMVDADPVSGDDAGMALGLDLPLGAGASTNVRYAFNVSPGNLWDAKLQVGNVIWEGNLNF